MFNLKLIIKATTVVFLSITVSLISSVSFAKTDVRIMWYGDGETEGVAFKNQIAKFHASNPNINVIVDEVPYKAIQDTLPVQLAAGEGPDIARVTDLGGLAKYYKDLTPFLKDPSYWESSYGPFLKWYRLPGDKTSINGFQSTMTVTGPYVNKTLFEQAGVNLLGAGATWDEWAIAANKVASKLNIAIPMGWDRSGHLVAGPAISMGAKYFGADGKPKLVDSGLKTMTRMLYDWHQNGTMSKDLWGSVSGTTYHAPNEWWNNAGMVMMMSGSWQINRFSKEVGDDFDWWAVPAPCGPSACTGMPGGNALVAFNANESVGKVMDFLASKESLREFIGDVLAIPGHLDLQVDYKTDNPLAKHALETFAGAVPTIDSIAFDLQAHVDNRILFNATISRLGQAIAGEMSLEEAWVRMDKDVTKQLKEKYGN
mgnify:FL=1